MRVRQVLVVGLCAVALAGCAAEKVEPIGIATSVTPTPSSGEVTVTDLSDPELGIVFVDTPELTGPAASAHDAVALFQRERWRTVTTGEVSALMTPLVSVELLRKVEGGLQRNLDGGWLLDGTLRVKITDVDIEGATATASVCVDSTEVTFKNVDGSAPKSYDEVGAPRHERTTLRLSTSDSGATWRPEDSSFESTSC